MRSWGEACPRKRNARRAHMIESSFNQSNGSRRGFEAKIWNGHIRGSTSRRHKFHALSLFLVWANISTRSVQRSPRTVKRISRVDCIYETAFIPLQLRGVPHRYRARVVSQKAFVQLPSLFFLRPCSRYLCTRVCFKRALVRIGDFVG